MPRRSTQALTGRTVDALTASARDVIVWDRELAGFGVRVYPSGRKVYVVQSRAGGSPRRVTLGTHGEITATQARKRAAQVIDRIKRGEDPAVPPPQAGTTSPSPTSPSATCPPTSRRTATPIPPASIVARSITTFSPPSA